MKLFIVVSYMGVEYQWNDMLIIILSAILTNDGINENETTYGLYVFSLFFGVLIDEGCFIGVVLKI